MTKFLLHFAAIAASLTLLTSCFGTEDDDPNYEDYRLKCEQFLADNAKREGVTVTTSGLQYEIVYPGNEDGKKPEPGAMVKCHYTGYFIDGRVFDSSYLSGAPATFRLSTVIKGWQEGLQLMKEGAKYRFVIPYQLGYGDQPYSTIPPYSTLIFEVELLEIL